jgi:hypothetical protein
MYRFVLFKINSSSVEATAMTRCTLPPAAAEAAAAVLYQARYWPAAPALLF